MNEGSLNLNCTEAEFKHQQMTGESDQVSTVKQLTKLALCHHDLNSLTAQQEIRRHNPEVMNSSTTGFLKGIIN